MTDIIFYFGSIIIIGVYIYLVIERFKEEDKIDLKEHFWIIVVYIFLVIISIIAWRIMYLVLISSTNLLINYNTTIENLING